MRNLTSPAAVRALLDELGLRPRRSLGQNFLIDRNILGVLVGAAGLSERDQVLEIGPGLGVVTGELIARARRVVAIEKDARLFAFLQAEFAACPALELVHADALDVDTAALFRAGVNVVVANLPYSVGSRLIAEFVGAEAGPERIVVTVQREVADRLAARPSSRAYGLLSVWTQRAYDVTLVKRVSATCFLPRPEVSSAILRLTRRAAAPARPDEMRRFRELTKSVFGQRRKQLASLLCRLPGEGWDAGRCRALLAEMRLDPQARPEDLGPDEWWTLACRTAGWRR